MSTTLSMGIYARLTGEEVMQAPWSDYQASLSALLGTDPDTTAPCVCFMDTNDSAQPQDDEGQFLSCITFRPSGGTPDNRFKDGFAVDDVIYDFEFWDYTRGATVITDIYGLVRRLLERRMDAPRMNLETNDRVECVWLEALTGLTVVPDKERNGWFGLIRYRAMLAEN